VTLRLALFEVRADSRGEGDRHPETCWVVLLGVLLLKEAEHDHRQVVELVNRRESLEVLDQLFLVNAWGQRKTTGSKEIKKKWPLTPSGLPKRRTLKRPWM